jgi:hypothetical protein
MTVKEGNKQDPAEAAKLADVIAVLEMANTKPADLVKSRAKVGAALTTMQTAKRSPGGGEADKLKAINVDEASTRGHSSAAVQFIAQHSHESRHCAIRPHF